VAEPVVGAAFLAVGEHVAGPRQHLELLARLRVVVDVGVIAASEIPVGALDVGAIGVLVDVERFVEVHRFDTLSLGRW
jgi:hypothetical protein